VGFRALEVFGKLRGDGGGWRRHVFEGVDELQERDDIDPEIRMRRGLICSLFASGHKVWEHMCALHALAYEHLRNPSEPLISRSFRISHRMQNDRDTLVTVFPIAAYTLRADQ
jgi:hypothetical protein